jgi:hypothetical protein
MLKTGLPKLIFSCAAIFSSLHSQAIGQGTPVVKSEPITITLAKVTDNPKVEGPIEIAFTLNNTGALPYHWIADRPDPAYKDFEFDLTTTEGPVKKTAYHRLIRGQHEDGDPLDTLAGSSMNAVIEPGHSVTFTINLLKLYQVTHPGTYTFTVTKRDLSSNVTTHSQPLVITVEP